MKSEKVNINSAGEGMKYALLITEGIGTDYGLDKKQVLQIRLLAEELLGMIRSLAGEVEASYWLENAEKRFDLHLKAEVPLTEDMRKQFLSISSTGENAAAKSFMGKIREMIATAIFATQVSDSEIFSGLSMGLTSMASPTAMGAGSGTYLWSLDKYKEEAKKDEEAWDELEKSIVAKLADEVSVKIVGANVEIIVSKEFK